MATVAELYGTKVLDEPTSIARDGWRRRHCPFTGIMCDVTANRSDRAFLDPERNHRVTAADAVAIQWEYGPEPLPLGICTVATKRRYAQESEPWIICPKRMLDLRTVPDIPQELRVLMPKIEPGATVRCWWEVKFSAPDPAKSRHFEYTFDYLLVPIVLEPGTGGARARIAEFVGPPYILEVMTSSTRGGGLTEHMTDVLLGRDQRPLVPPLVNSRYTPNYRQVFGRMVSQFFTKSEVAQAWGGQAVWVVQDQLVRYIAETTAFDATHFGDESEGTRRDGGLWPRGSRRPIQPRISEDVAR
jgi:hypothetical protein